MAKSKAFIAALSEEALERCTKEQLLKISEHYAVVVEDMCLKENIKVALKLNLVEMGVMTADPEVLSPVVTTILVQMQGLTFEQQKELLLIQMEQEKCKQELEVKKQIEV